MSRSGFRSMIDSASAQPRPIGVPESGRKPSTRCPGCGPFGYGHAHNLRTQRRLPVSRPWHQLRVPWHWIGPTSRSTVASRAERPATARAARRWSGTARPAGWPGTRRTERPVRGDALRPPLQSRGTRMSAARSDPTPGRRRRRCGSRTRQSPFPQRSLAPDAHQPKIGHK